jgi:hypothetical protein
VTDQAGLKPEQMALRALAEQGDINTPLRVEPDTERLGLWRVVEVDEDANNPLVCGGCTLQQAAYIAAAHPTAILALLDDVATDAALATPPATGHDAGGERVIPIPREALKGDPFRYVTDPPTFDDDDAGGEVGR